MKQVEPPLKVAVACMDLTEMDDIIIRYLKMVSDVKKFEHLYFVHVSRELNLPESVVQNYPDLLSPIDESIENGIMEKVENIFGKEVQVTVDVLEGHIAKEILHYLEIKQADLLVMGNKSTFKGSGSSATYLARRANCSVLYVPESIPQVISRILIPVDFSEATVRSYQVAELLCTPGTTSVSLMHVYNVPHGYSKTGKSYEEFDLVMLQNVEREFAVFMKDIPGEIIPDSHFVNGDHEHPEKLILDYADKINADLLIIGSRAKTTTAFILLGSMAEKILKANRYIPMLMIKRKNENLGFLEALKII